MSLQQIYLTGRLRADLEAADWLVRRDRGLSPAEQDAFLQWLAESPQNGEWLGRHQATWKNFNLLAQWRPEYSAEPNPDLLARARPTRRWAWPAMLAVAASVAVLFLVWRPVVQSGSPTSESGALGYERRVLEDSSVVELNRGAMIKVQFTPEERRVWLKQGEVQFTVAKNLLRPFVVQADRVKIRAVGTAFSVRLGEKSVEVFVTEGTVQVNPTSPKFNVTAPDGSLLHAGQRGVVSRTQSDATLKVEDLRPEEITRLLAWQPKLFDFNSVPLRNIVEAFNRCNRVKVVIADHSIDDRLIVASFRSDNVEGFVRLLEATTDVRAERTGDLITLHRAP